MSDRITSATVREWSIYYEDPAIDCLAAQMDVDSAQLEEMDRIVKAERRRWREQKDAREALEVCVAEKDATIARLQEQVDGLMSGKYNAVVTHEEQS